MLAENSIKDFNGNIITYEEFEGLAKDFDKSGYEVYIGSDSQLVKEKVSVVTCVCFHKNSGAGSRIFYVKERIDKKILPTLRSRMLYEAYKSLEAALEMDPLISGGLTVHLDIGADPIRCKTAKFKKELTMMVRSQGFGCEVKPYSWASSAVADRFTKT